ncbi:MAG: hypothetical protein AB7L91_03810 [Dehalococcoidia bacterium]
MTGHDARGTMATDESRSALDTEPEDAAEGSLRPAMLDDGQPAFPWWLPLPGVLLAAAWAAYRAAGAEDDGSSVLLETLLWPGAAIFVLTSLTAYFGWRLDLD